LKLARAKTESREPKGKSLWFDYCTFAAFNAKMRPMTAAATGLACIICRGRRSDLDDTEAKKEEEFFRCNDRSRNGARARRVAESFPSDSGPEDQARKTQSDAGKIAERRVAGKPLSY
jgi:hypothetical protein